MDGLATRAQVDRVFFFGVQFHRGGPLPYFARAHHTAVVSATLVFCFCPTAAYTPR